MRTLVTALVAMLLSLVPTAALACDCPELSVDEAAAEADAVVKVEVNRMVFDGTAGEYVYTMTPLAVWKGEFTHAIDVRVPRDVASCGIPEFRVHEEVLLFAQESERGYRTTICDRTQSHSQANEDELVAALGKPTAPNLDPEAIEGQTAEDAALEPDYVRTGIYAGILFVLLAVVVWQMMGRRRV